MFRSKLAAGAVLASGLLAIAHGGAEARIVCDGNFQIVNGYPVSTPYCRDATIASVARSYGLNVSDKAIRNDEGIKAQVCRTIGNDIRVYDACAPYLPDSGPNLDH
jgi:hypothetical protein